MSTEATGAYAGVATTGSTATASDPSDRRAAMAKRAILMAHLLDEGEPNLRFLP
ncbi:hypothetical protein AM571_CH01584 [Rhizobium etli 8C-3]|uniref:Uncharacterized protein n=1 Tax=Rhizobium etli 8C-3 TaxID=538025 RepID=A0A1L5P2M9_RHIET|nr:hypothetical protein AM571_CH01584 [Rhizobium etli 8C-3]